MRGRQVIRRLPMATRSKIQVQWTIPQMVRELAQRKKSKAMGTPVTRDERSVSRQKQLGQRNRRRAQSVSTSPVYDTGAVVDSECVLLTDAPSLLPRFDD